MATVTLRFEPSLSGNPCTKTYTIVPHGHKLLDTQPYAQDEFSCLGSKFVGAVKITSERPIAVAYMQYKSDYTTLLASSNTGGTGSTIYAPVVQNRNSGFTSGFSLLNASSAPALLSVYYYDIAQCYSSSTGINALKSIVVFPAPPDGNNCAKVVAAKLMGSAAGAQMNQIVLGTAQASDYPAISNPGRTVIVPRVRTQSGDWSSGLAVQNTGSSGTTVTITYYNKDGSNGGLASRWIAVNQAGTFFPLRTNTAPFDGSAVITAGQPLAVVVNHLNSGGGDNLSSHDGIHR